MSADIKFDRLTLTGDKLLPRELVLQLSRLGTLTAQAFPPRSAKYASWTIAYVNAKLADCRLEPDARHRHTLWMDHTAFDVTQAEAAHIHTTLAPLGLPSKFEERK
jgi:hypothetical protein